MKGIINFLKNEQGVTAVEYGLIAALIAGVSLLSIGALGTDVNNAFKNLSTAFPQ